MTVEHHGFSVNTVLAPSLMSIQRRVPMADVDAAGILYFGAPYRWLDETFTGWLSTLGHPLSGLLLSGDGCPCVASTASYDVPLVLDDEISLDLRPSGLGRTSFSLTIAATRLRDRAVAVRITAWYVWSEFDNKARPPAIQPAPTPEWLREAFATATWATPVINHSIAESDGAR